jgi:hypothetical protein
MAYTVELDDFYALDDTENAALWETLHSATDKVVRVYGRTGGDQFKMYDELVSLRVALTSIDAQRSLYRR